MNYRQVIVYLYLGHLADAQPLRRDLFSFQVRFGGIVESALWNIPTVRIHQTVVVKYLIAQKPTN